MRTRAAAVAVAAALLLSSCKTVEVTERTFFRPRPCGQASQASPEAPADEDLRIAATDGTRLQVLLTRPRDARALLIHFGGNETTHCPSAAASEPAVRRRARQWAAAENLGVAYVNYRGYGASEGTASIEAGLRDAVAVYDSLVADPRFTGRPVFLHGQSLGAAFAIALATERPVRGLILESPPTTARAVLSNVTPWYLEPFLRYRLSDPLARQDNAEALRSVDVPLLVVVGEHDRITPPRMAAAVLAAARSAEKKLVVVPGGHGDLARNDPFWSALSGFVRGLPGD